MILPLHLEISEKESLLVRQMVLRRVLQTAHSLLLEGDFHTSVDEERCQANMSDLEEVTELACKLWEGLQSAALTHEIDKANTLTQGDTL